MVLNFTPLRETIKSYKDKLILICGSLNVVDIVEELNLNNYLTLEEYVTLFPFLVPFSNR